MNKVFLCGYIGKDVEVKQAKTGSFFTDVSLATSKGVKVGDKWENKTTWHNCVAFGKLAENLAKLVGKGDKLAVQGSLDVSSYTDKNGEKRWSTKVIIEEFQAMEANKTTSYEEKTTVDYGNKTAGDDIPF